MPRSHLVSLHSKEKVHSLEVANGKLQRRQQGRGAGSKQVSSLTIRGTRVACPWGREDCIPQQEEGLCLGQQVQLKEMSIRRHPRSSGAGLISTLLFYFEYCDFPEYQPLYSPVFFLKSSPCD